MNEEEQFAFSADPHFEDALRVRTWDDIGKQTEWRAESTSVAIATLESLMRKVSSDNT
jgi:predicted HD phosphohydrolase